MSLDDEMHHEVDRLEKEIAAIDEELKRINDRMMFLMRNRSKKEHDLRILKMNFGEIEDTETQTTLARLLEERMAKKA